MEIAFHHTSMNMQTRASRCSIVLRIPFNTESLLRQYVCVRFQSRGLTVVTIQSAFNLSTYQWKRRFCTAINVKLLSSGQTSLWAVRDSKSNKIFFPGNSCSNQVEHHQCIAQRRQDTLWPLAPCTRHPLALFLGTLSPVLPSAWRSPTSTATGNVLPSVPSSSL